MTHPHARAWQALTSPEAGALADSDPVAVLPLAAVEQHGPHLPLSTDVEIGEGLLRIALRALPPAHPVYLLPTQAVGASEEHLGFPGTLSLPPRLLDEVVVELGRSLARAGVRRLVLHNAHGGNRPVLDTAALRLRREEGMLVVKVTWARFPRPAGVELPEEEWQHGIHGGAVETAMMLHLRPELVRHDAIRDFPPLGARMESEGYRTGPEGVAPLAWVAEDLHPSGAAGDPRLATPGMGEVLVEHYGRCLAEVIREAATLPLPGGAAPPGDRG